MSTRDKLRKRLEKAQSVVQPQITSRPAKLDDVMVGRGLFSPNHPLKQKAEEVFSKEEMDEYKRQGEYMYSFDYDKINIDGSGSDETTQFILMALRSGLQVESLGEDEVEFMRSVHGENWREKFGL